MARQTPFAPHPGAQRNDLLTTAGGPRRLTNRRPSRLARQDGKGDVETFDVTLPRLAFEMTAADHLRRRIGGSHRRMTDSMVNGSGLHGIVTSSPP